MFKLFRLIIGLALILGIVYFFLAYQVVRMKDGIHVVKKDELKFTTPLLDTRDWNIGDYVKHPEIAKKLGSLKIDKLTDTLSEGWQEFTQSVDKWVKDFDKEKLSETARKDWDQVEKAIKEKFNDLNRQYKNGDINLDGFKAKLAQLRDWADQQWTPFREKNLKE